MSKIKHRMRVKSALPPVSGIRILMPTIEDMPVQATLGDNTDSDSLFPDKHICKFCEKTFLRNDHLKRHIRDLHTISDCYLCPVCDTNCESYKTFCSHLNTVHKTHSNFSCKNCQYATKSVTDFLSHYEEHLVADNYLHKCPQCDATFKRADHVKRHIKNIHDKKLLCSDCRKVFATRSELNKHVKTHAEPKAKKRKVDNAL